MTKVFLRLLLGGVVGKMLGLVREVALAALFGAGRVIAANRVALTGTFVPINFFTADALSAGFLPLYVRYRAERPALAAVLYRSVRLILLGFSVLLVLALLVGGRLVVRLLGPGLDAETASMATSMLAVTGLGVPFYIQYNLYALICLAHDDVRLINIRASFQSVGIICGTALAYLSGRATLLAWGFTVPYVLLCVWGRHWVRKRNYLAVAEDGTQPAGDRGEYRQAAAMFWRRLRPLILVPVALQGSIVVERAVGSLLGYQVVASTEYARFVVDSVMVLVAAPLGLASLAAFPKLDDGDVAAGLRRLVPPILLTTLPLSMILALDCRPIVALLYRRGQFDLAAQNTTAVMLLGFALGIWAQVLGYTLVKVLNARGANGRAAVVTALSFSAALAVNLLLYRYWGAFTIGFAATVGGVVMCLAAARALSVLRSTLRLMAALVPAVATATVLALLIPGSGVVRLVLSTAAILGVWVAYVALVPQLRSAYGAPMVARARQILRVRADQRQDAVEVADRTAQP